MIYALLSQISLIKQIIIVYGISLKEKSLSLSKTLFLDFIVKLSKS